MSGSKIGGLTAAQRNKERYDNVSPYKEYGGFYQYIGAKGGRKGTTGGFAAGEAGRMRASYYGRIGGLKSKRKSKNEG